MSALTQTDFNFPGQQSVYHGKVRDVYHLGDRLVMVATDRISAFDVVLPEGILTRVRCSTKLLPSSSTLPPTFAPTGSSLRPIPWLQ